MTYTPHPLRIQRKRTKGFKLPAGAICVTRPGKWGNPFKPESAMESGYASSIEEARRFSVECFRDWLLCGDLSMWWFAKAADSHVWMRTNLETLYGKQLACWCPLTRPCHADVLAEFANGDHLK